MAYVRWSENSDVYIYHDVSDVIVCCACKLESGIDSFGKRSKVIDHIEEHRRAGHLVPEYVDEILREEIELEGDDVFVDRGYNKKGKKE